MKFDRFIMQTFGAIPERAIELLVVSNTEESFNINSTFNIILAPVHLCALGF